MRLYHWGMSIKDFGLRTWTLNFRKVIPLLVGLAGVVLLVSCSPPRVTQSVITIYVRADGDEHTVEVPAGVTAEDALNAAGVILTELDRSDPPFYTVLSHGSVVRLIRVEEDYSVEQVVIPFEQQVLQNESLPAGEEYWLQLGKNGLQEITTRRVYEDGVEISSNVVNTVIIEEAEPQIKMVGVQKPFTPIPIPGRLAYLLDGNAWVMEGTTGSRRQVVSSGDLDGRVFSLSSDGIWLLFTRSDEDEDTINTLWAAKVDDDEGLEIDLEVANIVHFADWKPGSIRVVGYSTVEPREAAPGWQANNDLQLLTFSDSGYIRQLPTILDTNLGGLYGWWGTDFAWAPDGLSLAYARPDSVGVVDNRTGEQRAVLEFTPLQTYGDWAWVPGVAWGPDGKVIFSETHLPPAESQLFDLTVSSIVGGAPISVVPQVGMFSYPVPSPITDLPSGEESYRVAYLQAIFPNQSETSRYRLMVMDRDGSNRQVLFPQDGAGLEPQSVVWSPKQMEARTDHALAMIFQGNLYLVDVTNAETWQITGDGLTSHVDWR